METTIPKFLKNTPIGEDHFEGKSQEKIATVITNILKNENFQIIGIDGSWGTGKSNLVHIIEKKLNDSKFFIYDVWGHQEDDQRKSILVELTEFISDKNVVSNKAKWGKKLKRLLAKEKEVTTINRPYLSIGFILSLILIIYIPTVNTFAKDLNTVWKVLLILVPIFLILLIYLWKAVYLLCWGKHKLNSFKLAFQQTFQVYNNKQLDETRIETISENEPSVKDFRGWMKEIDTDLGIQKLVLVFDNFDRLPKKQILSIWSSIHIFFSEEKYKNIKVIIPFDRLHIKNAFSELNGSNENDYANDYINKTFDLVYRVSPPILSDWKIYFKAKWNEAFTIIDEAEYLRVEQIYEVFRLTITPREIIAFINEVVSIKLLDSNIPDRYIAIFVLNKDTILGNPLKAITESIFLGGLSYLYKEEEDFQKYITALAYQINPDSSLEVVYMKQLKDSLIHNKFETLLEISKTTIFHKIIFTVLAEIENLETSVLTLTHLNSDSRISGVEIQKLWDDIYQRIKTQEMPDFELKDYQKILLVKVSSVYKNRWLDIIIDNINKHEDFNSLVYSYAIDELDKLINDNSLGRNIFNSLTEKKIGVENFVSLVRNKEGQYRKYKVTCDESELNRYLSNRIPNDYADLNLISHLVNDFEFSALEQHLRNVLTSQPSQEVVSSIINFLKLITKELKGILNDDQIYSLFQTSNPEDDFYFDLTAMRLASSVNFNQSYQSIFDPILQKEDIEFIKKIAERIENYVDTESFFLNSLTFGASKLYEGLVREFVTIEPEDSPDSKVDNLLLHFDEICDKNDLEPQAFISYLDNFECGLEGDAVLSLSNHYFEEAMKSDTKLAKTTIKKINNHYRNFTKDEWSGVFKTLKGKQVEQLSIIKFKGWNSFALETLKEHLILVIQSKKLENPEILKKIIQGFEDSGKDLINTFKDVRDELLTDRNISSDMFLFFQEWLFKYASLEEKAGDVIRTIFKVNFLDDETCVGVFSENSDFIKNLILKSSSSDSSDLKDGIRDRIGIAIIDELADKLGIRNQTLES